MPSQPSPRSSSRVLANRKFFFLVLALAIILLVSTEGCGGGANGITSLPPPPRTYTTIDAPGAAAVPQVYEQGTFVTGLNDAGEVAGTLYDGVGSGHGFFRSSDGQFTVFDGPQAYSGFALGTWAAAINRSGTIVRSYTMSVPPLLLPFPFPVRYLVDGFVRTKDGTITLEFASFDLPITPKAVPSVNLFGIDDNGHTGAFVITDEDAFYGFVQTTTPSGALTGATFSPAGPPSSDTGLRIWSASLTSNGVVLGRMAGSDLVYHSYVFDPSQGSQWVDFPSQGTTTIAYSGTQISSMNTSGTIVGTFTDASSIPHSFVRSPDGTFSMIDPPGTVSTAPPGGSGLTGSSCYGINDSGFIVGQYTDTNFITHGYVRDPQGNFTTLDAPNASQTPRSMGTSATAINGSGAIIGQYFDAQGVRHGFIRQ